MYLTIKENGDVSVENIEMSPKGHPQIIKFVRRANELVGGTYKEMPCGYLEKKGINQLAMLINEKSEYDDSFRFNSIASILHGVEYHGHVIYGDVCIVWKPFNYKTGIETLMPMDSEQIRLLLNEIHSINSKAKDKNIWRLKNGNN